MSVPEQQDNISEESLFEAPPMNQQMRMIEAILFATVEPMTVNALNERMPHGCDAAEALARLRKSYAGRGVNVMKIGDAWAIRTASDLSFLMQKERAGARKTDKLQASVNLDEPPSADDDEQEKVF